MPVYTYTLLDERGDVITGEISAVSAAEADAILRSQQKFVISVKETQAPSAGQGLLGDVTLNTLFPPGVKDVALLFRQLGVLLSSGVSLVQALLGLERQAAHRPRMKRLVTGLRNAVESGRSFSEGMAETPRVFSPYMVNMARSADISGELDVVMTRMADYMDQRLAFRRTLISSMVYPCLVVLMAMGAVGVLSLVVVPKFIPFLHGKNLPWATQSLLDMTAWMRQWWKALLAATIGVIVGLPLIRKTDEGRYVMDAFFLRVPVIGQIVRCGMVVDFSRNLATMFASGVPLSQGLEAVLGTMQNAVAKRLVSAMLDNVMEGGTMSEVLHANERIFTPLVSEMIATGEQTGEMERALNITGDIYQRMLETYVKTMNTLIEPLLIILLGSMVGFVFYALISGMLAVYGV